MSYIHHIGLKHNYYKDAYEFISLAYGSLNLYYPFFVTLAAMM